MSEEENVEEIETLTQVRLKALDAEKLSEATKVMMTVEGDADIVLGLADAVMTLLQVAFGGEVAYLRDGQGNDIPLPGPTVIDATDLGDDPVA